MPDREKVIKGMECCMSDGSECYEPSNGKCPYYKDDVTASACTDDLFYDIYALLKAQEPMSPVTSEVQYGDHLQHCPSCGKALPNSGEYGISHYCYKCGQAVKWDG